MYREFKSGAKNAGFSSETYESHESFKDCGRILKKNEVVVDIDNVPKEVLKSLIKEFDINTEIVWTERGVHLYYIKPDIFRQNKGFTPVGLSVEYKKKTGKNDCVTIKRNGVLRTIENEGIREPFPDFLKPSKEPDYSLFGLGESDGRNNALAKHAPVVKGVKNPERVISFINEHIFSEPLPNGELDGILKLIDKSNSEEIPEFVLVAREICEKFQFFDQDGILWFREGKRFVTGRRKIKRLVTNYCVNKNLSFEREVLNKIEGFARFVEDSRELPIYLRNGFIKKGVFFESKVSEESSLPFSPFYIDIEYKRDVLAIKIVDDFLDNVTQGDKDYKNLFLEMIASSLITDKYVKQKLARFFILYGEGSNGKGTVLDVIRRILGHENTSDVSLERISDEKNVFPMIGKLMNLGDDIMDTPIGPETMKVLKNLSTADTFTARELYQSPVTLNYTGTLLFTSNNRIKSFEKTESFKRRILWMPMESKINDAKKVHNIAELVTTKEAKEYWLSLIMDALQRLMRNLKYTDCQMIQDYNEKYHEENNNTLMWAEDTSISEVEGKSIGEIMQSYEDWCSENYERPLKKKTLISTLNNFYGLYSRSINIDIQGNGKRTKKRIFMKEDS